MARVPGVTGSALPVELAAVDALGQPVTSVGTFLLSLVVAITRASDGFGWDFSTSSFKAAPVTPTAALTEVSITKYPGLCHLVGGWTPPVSTLATGETYTFTITRSGGAFVPANVPASFTTYVGPCVGTAVLGTNLVDDLVPVADSLRQELHADFGVRQFKVKQIKRTWTGGRIGLGAARIVYVREILPAPRVKLGDRHNLTEGGVQETGVALLTEVSLTYSEADLMGDTAGDLTAETEFFYKLDDAIGQGIASRLFIPQDHPWPDREKNIGWEVSLRRVDQPPLVVY